MLLTSWNWQNIQQKQLNRSLPVIHYNPLSQTTGFEMKPIPHFYFELFTHKHNSHQSYCNCISLSITQTLPARTSEQLSSTAETETIHLNKTLRLSNFILTWQVWNSADVSFTVHIKHQHDSSQTFLPSQTNRNPVIQTMLVKTSIPWGDFFSNFG